MDGEAIESLDRAFHYRFAALLAAGVVAVVGGAWLLAPGETAFYSLVGLPIVVFLGAATLAVATDQRVEAGGHLVAAAGAVVILVGTATDPAPVAGVADPLFWGGLSLLFVGGLVGLLADHADAIRDVVLG